MSTISMVIADDQVLFVDLLRSIIENRAGDFEILGCAYDGQEAIEMILDRRPDIALVDIRMPRADGVEVTRRICSASDCVKVVVLTTFPDDEYVGKALEYGASGYLLKNMTADDLISSIRSIHRGSFVVSETIARHMFRNPSTGGMKREPDEGLSAQQREMMNLLSRREREVYVLMVRGRSNDEIADMLYISRQTVKNHISTIYKKIGMHTRADIYRM